MSVVCDPRARTLDAFQLLRALEPVADELEAVGAEPALRELVGAATAAARSGPRPGQQLPEVRTGFPPQPAAQGRGSRET